MFDWSWIPPVAIFVIAGAWWRWRKVKRLLKESAEVLTVLSNAIEDDQLTPEELRGIAEEFADVVIAAQDLVRPKDA